MKNIREKNIDEQINSNEYSLFITIPLRLHAMQANYIAFEVLFRLILNNN